MNSERGKIAFSDGNSRVVLAPCGPAGALGPAGLGVQTRIEVFAGPFSAITEAEAWGYELFRDQLIHIHETLAGDAELTFVEDGHSLSFRGDGRGRVHAEVVITDGRGDYNATLTVTMLLDQSYLPDIIHTIRRAFLADS